MIRDDAAVPSVLTIVSPDEAPAHLETHAPIAAVLTPLVQELVAGIAGVQLPLVLKLQKTGNAWLCAYVDETHGLRVPIGAQILSKVARGRAAAKDLQELRHQVEDLAANLRSRDRTDMRFFRPATRGLEVFKK